MSIEQERAMTNPAVGQYAIVALTEYGKQTALRLQKQLQEKQCTVYTTEKIADETVTALKGRTIEAIRELFQSVDVLICIMATGIVIRAIAPCVQDKLADPAVIVMDEKAKNVISLLSGHMGGANSITQRIAEKMQANPVITTATDVHDVTALDMIAKSVNGWEDAIRPLLLQFNGYLAAHKPVYFYQEKEWITDVRGLRVIDAHQLQSILLQDVPLIVLQTKPLHIEREQLVVIHPKPYIVGVGARKNVDADIFEQNFYAFCQQETIQPEEVAFLASIDLKKEEKAIVSLANKLNCPFVTYTKEQLETVADKYPQSEFVKKMVGVGSVSQAAADYASLGEVISERFAKDGCTFALARYKNKKA